MFLFLGGLNHIENDKDKMSNPELRKARFDLLFREYEVITLHNKKWKFLISELAKNKIFNTCMYLVFMGSIISLKIF